MLLLFLFTLNELNNVFFIRLNNTFVIRLKNRTLLGIINIIQICAHLSPRPAFFIHILLSSPDVYFLRATFTFLSDFHFPHPTLIFFIRLSLSSSDFQRSSADFHFPHPTFLSWSDIHFLHPTLNFLHPTFTFRVRLSLTASDFRLSFHFLHSTFAFHHPTFTFFIRFSLSSSDFYFFRPIFSFFNRLPAFFTPLSVFFILTSDFFIRLSFSSSDFHLLNRPSFFILDPSVLFDFLSMHWKHSSRLLDHFLPFSFASSIASSVSTCLTGFDSESKKKKKNLPQLYLPSDVFDLI